MVGDLFSVIEPSHGRTRPAIELAVVVQPAARSSAVVGVRDGAVRVRVAAPAVEGKANAATVALMAHVFGVRKSAVTVVSGHHARRKRLRIEGVAVATAARVLADVCGIAPGDAGATEG